MEKDYAEQHFTVEILESRLKELSKISVDEQIGNPALMMAVTDAINRTVALLVLLDEV